MSFRRVSCSGGLARSGFRSRRKLPLRMLPPSAMPKPARPRPRPAVPATAPAETPPTSSIRRSPASRPTTSPDSSHCSSRASATTRSCLASRRPCRNRTCTISARIRDEAGPPPATATSPQGPRRSALAHRRRQARHSGLHVVPRSVGSRQSGFGLSADRRPVDRLRDRQAQGRQNGTTWSSDDRAKIMPEIAGACPNRMSSRSLRTRKACTRPSRLPRQPRKWHRQPG